MPPLTRTEYEVLLLALSWVGGFLPLFLGPRARAALRPAFPWVAPDAAAWTWVRCVGLGLLLSPFVRMGLGIYLSIDALFTYEVLQPVAREALWLSVQTRLVNYLVLPGVGLLLMRDAVPLLGRGRLRDALQAHGLAPRRSWRRDAMRGLALFFAIAVAYLGAYALSRLVPSLVAGGDESAYWRNVTLPLIVLLSATAGLTEEFLFRGVLLRGLARVMPWWPAALVQAVLFGLIHAGYGTWTHVLAPAVFGLGMAWVARVLGVVPAALLHAQVNVLFFSIDVAPAYVAAQGLPGLAGLGALVLALAAASAWALWRTRADGVVLLWRSLLGGLKEVPDPDAVPTSA
ncbi:MAG TPA: CPBP family intramembrane glutamic endopeptidase [Candidatus Thermoplasmatota archaeon]|nr:CPBP family intramembrane glutamic endopeptidase [Candidatus Thermoplasmatota archaeon]